MRSARRKPRNVKRPARWPVRARIARTAAAPARRSTATVSSAKLQNMCEPAPTPLKESGAERRARARARAERAPKKILMVVGLLDAISIKSLTHTLGRNQSAHPQAQSRVAALRAYPHAAARSARVLQRRAPRVSLYLASALRACVSS